MKVLERVEVTPRFFPHSSQLAHEGNLVPTLGDALQSVDELPSPTLADLLTHGAADIRPPPGFAVAARYAATQARLWGLPVAVLELHCQGGEILPTSGCSIVAAGPHSLVLRIGDTADYVVKISSVTSIQREVSLHEQADSAECLHLRRLHCSAISTGQPLWGTVRGAGDGLGFLALEGFFPSSLQRHNAGTTERFARLASQVAHGKPNACLAIIPVRHLQGGTIDILAWTLLSAKPTSHWRAFLPWSPLQLCLMLLRRPGRP